jgi:hypothetical protein
MAEQICPNCKTETFNWLINEEETSLTQWRCYTCGYNAYEDESFARECSNCHKKTENCLEDETKKYWWCSSCNRVTDVGVK